MAGLGTLEENLKKLDTARQETREVIREAHEAAKTLKLFLKEYKEVRGELLERAKATATAQVEAVVEERIASDLQTMTEEFAQFRDHWMMHMAAVMRECAELVVGWEGRNPESVFQALDRFFQKKMQPEAWLPDALREKYYPDKQGATSACTHG